MERTRSTNSIINCLKIKLDREEGSKLVRRGAGGIVDRLTTDPRTYVRDGLIRVRLRASAADG